MKEQQGQRQGGAPGKKAFAAEINKTPTHAGSIFLTNLFFNDSEMLICFFDKI